MIIEHDNKGLGSSWCVDYVEIHFPDKALHFGENFLKRLFYTFQLQDFRIFCEVWMCFLPKIAQTIHIYFSDVDRWMEKGRVDTTQLKIAYSG